MNKFSLSTENEYKILFVIQQIQFIIRNFQFVNLGNQAFRSCFQGTISFPQNSESANKGLSRMSEEY